MVEQRQTYSRREFLKRAAITAVTVPLLVRCTDDEPSAQRPTPTTPEISPTPTKDQQLIGQKVAELKQTIKPSQTEASLWTVNPLSFQDIGQDIIITDEAKHHTMDRIEDTVPLMQQSECLPIQRHGNLLESYINRGIIFFRIYDSVQAEDSHLPFLTEPAFSEKNVHLVANTSAEFVMNKANSLDLAMHLTELAEETYQLTHIYNSPQDLSHEQRREVTITHFSDHNNLVKLKAQSYGTRLQATLEQMALVSNFSVAVRQPEDLATFIRCGSDPKSPAWITHMHTLYPKPNDEEITTEEKTA